MTKKKTVKKKKVVKKAKTKSLQPLNVIVHRVYDDSDFTHSNLGITDERLDVLNDELIGYLEANGGLGKVKVTDVMIKLGQVCKHPNELAYMNYTFGHGVGVGNAATSIVIQRTGGQDGNY